jgi:chemotaxis protein histidine kinase CheA
MIKEAFAMKMLLLTLPLALVLLSSPLLAQGSGEEEEEFDVVKAMKEVQRLLRESEALLVKAIAPRAKGDGEDAADAGQKAREAIEKLLKDSRQSGEDAADKMKEILEKAPQQQGRGGGGGGQHQQEPKPGEEGKQKGSEKEVGDRDPKNSKENGDPKSEEKSKSDPQAANQKPEESEKDKAARPDPIKEWLGRLPSKIRQAYQNGEWDRIPERWRKLIQEYTRKMADIESDR